MTFPTSLPTKITAALEAINNRDSNRFYTSFSSNATIIDEGKTLKGHASIKDFCNKAFISHSASIIFENVIQVKDHTIVQVTMDGDFVADYGITEPFTLYFNFHLQDASITSLLITPWDSSKLTMTAVYVDKANIDNPISTIKIAPRLQPIPQEGWVKVKMLVVGLNYHDIFTMRGLGMRAPKFPLILGCEGAGVLEDGTEVLLYPAMGNPDFNGEETLDPDRHVLSEQVNGTMAEYVVVPQRNVVPKPKELATVSAAVLGIAWLTAYRMLFTKSGLRAGQTMLVQGSSGGVTTALVQLGSAAGMRVWCMGRTQEKRELGLKLGAERAFESGEKLPEKVDAVFDTSGELTWAHSIDSVKAGGSVVTCGSHSGGSIPMEFEKVFVEQLNIRGSYLGTLQEFKDLISFVMEKSIVPHVGRVLPLSEVDVGFQAMIDGKTAGKIVVTI
ncbi:NAD(P)-binding protein [Hyaloscypha variabilis F]|uniref:NAD(P)-binding protein n=1 Tax=Hyaloscypha variabilis (strain UAMH 11265 / GT02V1 / F) TaxID=1149755 RepID=A0A2J6S263_HYAVF|nr:NAD(P)-binding protein [Hyaloscypha variabilis F]